MKWGKWIGGGLGWTLFGPIGAIFGFAAGAIIDADENINTGKKVTTRGDFIASFLVLVAAVMKADGTVKRSELDFVKKILKDLLGNEEAQEALLTLRDILKKDIALENICYQINTHLEYESKLQLIHLLIGIAHADNELVNSEILVIKKIANLLNIPASSFESLICSGSSIEDAYKILEVSPDASDEEIKKTYRKLALIHHPDKVSYLGEEIQKKAQEKFKKINEAYEMIKKHRGFK
ncbi:MAG: TerB family tellurite resistance protein [Bacteroidales bacterium]|nr:TerB family tellurite resistance protein [Bacteroidales bacterium]